MTRNLKIALGCGGAGCLGLIVVIAAGSVGYFFYKRQGVANSNYNFNLNSNSSDSNSSDNRSSTSPADDTSSSEESSSSSMADDDKHKLFQAVNMTQDTAQIQRVWKKLGFMTANGSMTPAYEQFVKDHFAWTMKNLDFIQSINTPEKARAYVEEHIDD